MPWTRWFRQIPEPFPPRTERARAMSRRQVRAAAGLEERLRALEEENRKLESINRIQQVEIDELTAVIARNLERVKAETRLLAHPAPDRGALPRILNEELDSHD
jgi:hypothetical protein